MSIVFDQAAGYYDQTRGVPSPIEQWITEAAQDPIGLTAHARVLETG